MTDVSTSPRERALLDELAAALADAVSWDFDLPSDYAYSRAKSLLHRLSGIAVQPNGLDVAVAEDGSIHLGLNLSSLYHDVRITPDGARISLGLIDYPNRRVAEPAEELEEAEILSRLERAAAA